MGFPTLKRDPAGNVALFDPAARFVHESTRRVSAIGNAAAALATLSGASGKTWVIDGAQFSLASIAAATTVLVTVVDGTTAVCSFAASANGQYTPLDTLLSKVSIAGTSGAALGLQASTPGTGGTVTLNLFGHLVNASDV